MQIHARTHSLRLRCCPLVSQFEWKPYLRRLCLANWLSSLPLFWLGRTTVILLWQLGLPNSLLSRLQSVINSTARLIAGFRRSDHITDTLASFHWLRASQRIKFKLAVLVYRALHGTATSLLDVRPSHRDTVANRSFTTARTLLNTARHLCIIIINITTHEPRWDK